MKPILFSTPMVQAIIAVGKTQTRRVIKPQPQVAYGGVREITYEPHPFRASSISEAVGRPVETGVPNDEMAWVAYDWCGNPVGVEDSDWLKPRYRPGDILWVRETWFQQYDGSFAYKASAPPNSGWKPSIHMPRKAARIFLRVTGVRVERVQEITEEDAIAEGATEYSPGFETEYGTNAWRMVTARTKFCALWDAINAKRGYSWESNPWVWVIEFEQITEAKGSAK